MPPSGPVWVLLRGQENKLFGVSLLPFPGSAKEPSERRLQQGLKAPSFLYLWIQKADVWVLLVKGAITFSRFAWMFLRGVPSFTLNLSCGALCQDVQKAQQQHCFTEGGSLPSHAFPLWQPLTPLFLFHTVKFGNMSPFLGCHLGYSSRLPNCFV